MDYNAADNKSSTTASTENSRQLQTFNKLTSHNLSSDSSLALPYNCFHSGAVHETQKDTSPSQRLGDLQEEEEILVSSDEESSEGEEDASPIQTSCFSQNMKTNTPLVLEAKKLKLFSMHQITVMANARQLETTPKTKFLNIKKSESIGVRPAMTNLSVLKPQRRSTSFSELSQQAQSQSQVNPVAVVVTHHTEDLTDHLPPTMPLIGLKTVQLSKIKTGQRQKRNVQKPLLQIPINKIFHVTSQNATKPEKERVARKSPGTLLAVSRLQSTNKYYVTETLADVHFNPQEDLPEDIKPVVSKTFAAKLNSLKH